MSVLGFWVIRGVSSGEPLLLLWGAAKNSLYVSALAAGATVVAALPIAILTGRFPGILSSLLERVAYIGFALPGIAVALGLVFFGANYALPLYQTLGLLVLAYVVLFLPTAVGAVRASLLRVSPNMEHAARSLGRSPLQVLTSVTLPLVRPGILSGAALVFLLTMKELPATLILGPIGFTTLATSIWSAASEAFFAQAAAPALLLILASSLPLAFLTLREQKPS
jgi:iron(III) transport system permease protein